MDHPAVYHIHGLQQKLDYPTDLMHGSAMTTGPSSSFHFVRIDNWTIHLWSTYGSQRKLTPPAVSMHNIAMKTRPAKT